MKNIFLKISCLSLIFFACDARQYVIKGAPHTKYSTKRQKIKLFKSVGCEYFNCMEIDVAGFDLIDPTATDHFLMQEVTIQEHSKKYYKQVQQYALASMYLQWISPDIGYGVFAAKDILKDEFIGVYAGQLRVMRGPGSAIPEDVDYAWYYPINFATDQRLLIDGKLKGNELRCINHDQQPNTKCINVLVDGVFYMCYVATKDIAKDVQLTISYWDSRKINPAKIK